jgi:hypothetical protein
MRNAPSMTDDEAKLLASLTPKDRALVERVMRHHPALTVAKAEAPTSAKR